MRPIIPISFISLLSCITLLSCDNNSDSSRSDNDTGTWYAYTEEGSDLWGFSDKSGNIMIEPVFGGAFAADRFDDVVTVSSEEAGSNKTYFLNKKGQQFGYDSAYIADTKFDCEHEGFIRFRDNNKKTGLFDKNGHIIIPSVHDDLSQVHDGYLFAVNGARLADTAQTPAAANYIWNTGKTSLINLKKEILIDSLRSFETLDLHELSVHRDRPEELPYNRIFDGKDGLYYAIFDNRKAFEYFFLDIDTNDFEKHLYPYIVHQNTWGEWTESRHTEFWQVHKRPVLDFLAYALNKDNLVFFNIQSVLPMSDAPKIPYEMFMDNCNNWNTMQYPVFEIAYYLDEENTIYNALMFIKVEGTFRLIGSRLAQTPAQL